MRGTATTTRAVDSENSQTNGSAPSGSTILRPGLTGQAHLHQRLHQPALGQVVRGGDHPVPGSGDQDVAEPPLGLQIDRRRQPTEMAVHDLGPGGAVELVTGLTQQQQGLAGVLADARDGAAPDVIDDAEHPDHRGGQDVHPGGLVVEADIAAGDRDPSCAQPSAMPWMACSNCHITAGSSGEPKFRQSVTASGAAPVVTTLR